MNNSFLTGIGIGIAAFLASAEVLAGSFTGSIGFNADLALTGPPGANLGNVVQLTPATAPPMSINGSPNGIYAAHGIGAGSSLADAFMSGNSGAVLDLNGSRTFTVFSFTWSGSGQKLAYSLVSSAFTVQTQNSWFLNLEGSGTAYIKYVGGPLNGQNAYEPCQARWTLTGTGVSGWGGLIWGLVATALGTPPLPEPAIASFKVVGQSGAPAGQVIQKVVLEAPASSVSAMDLRLTYNPEVASLVSLAKGSLASGMQLTSRAPAAGVLELSLSTASRIGGTGDVVMATFQAAQETKMKLTSVSVNPGTTSVVNWDLDSDGDGLSDLEETLAGTDPRNSSDALRIGALEPVPNNGGEKLSLPTLAGKVYRVERNDNYPTGPWVQVGTDVVGTGAAVPIVDGAAFNLQQAVYRVRVVNSN